jgi:hypothetical protein
VYVCVLLVALMCMYITVIGLLCYITFLVRVVVARSVNNPFTWSSAPVSKAGDLISPRNFSE